MVAQRHPLAAGRWLSPSSSLFLALPASRSLAEASRHRRPPLATGCAPASRPAHALKHPAARTLLLACTWDTFNPTNSAHKAPYHLSFALLAPKHQPLLTPRTRQCFSLPSSCLLFLFFLPLWFPFQPSPPRSLFWRFLLLLVFPSSPYQTLFSSARPLEQSLLLSGTDWRHTAVLASTPTTDPISWQLLRYCASNATKINENSTIVISHLHTPTHDGLPATLPCGRTFCFI